MPMEYWKGSKEDYPGMYQKVGIRHLAWNNEQDNGKCEGIGTECGVSNLLKDIIGEMISEFERMIRQY